MKVEVSVREYVVGLLALRMFKYPDDKIHMAVRAVNEEILSRHMENIEEYLLDGSEVDYPAGRDAGHCIKFNYELSEMEKWFNEYFQLRTELNRYLYGELKL